MQMCSDNGSTTSKNEILKHCFRALEAPLFKETNIQIESNRNMQLNWPQLEPNSKQKHTLFQRNACLLNLFSWIQSEIYLLAIRFHLCS